MSESQKEAICKLANVLQKLVPCLYVHIGEDLSRELAEATTELQSTMKEPNNPPLTEREKERV